MEIKKLNVIVNGCNGKMGQVLVNEINKCNDMKLVAGIDKSPNKYNNSFPVFDDIFMISEHIDVIIDFSNPKCLSSLLKYGVQNNIPLVIATTGFSKEDLIDIELTSKKIPVFYSANMSLGINLLINLVKKASLILENWDIEIIEKHHNKKIDAPSGTAYMIADNINETLNNSKEYNFGRYTKTERRKNNEIGIHAIRGGSIVGEHSVIFAGKDEVLEVNHYANSKKIFAIGSINAAKFIYTKAKGLYNMENLINII